MRAHRDVVLRLDWELDVAVLTALARGYDERGQRHVAVAALDRAWGLAPDDDTIQRQRARLLDDLAVELAGLRFRYIPAGTFLMGSEDGEPDEAPVHPVYLDPYWLQEVPLSWDDFQRILAWDGGFPPEERRPKSRMGMFHLYEDNKIRSQYCEDGTSAAIDWHAHSGSELEDLFGVPPRDDSIPYGYATKPMVSVGWQDILSVAEAMEDEQPEDEERFLVDLPTEAEWERAARGGLIGARHPWGDAPPTSDRADFDHFGVFAIRPSRELPPNSYGLYAMAGGVWEWCADWYDAEAYARRVSLLGEDEVTMNPRGPKQGLMKVLRGGSWADCAGALRVSFRNAQGSSSWSSQAWGEHTTPNLGARLVLRPAEPLL